MESAEDNIVFDKDSAVNVRNGDLTLTARQGLVSLSNFALNANGLTISADRVTAQRSSIDRVGGSVTARISEFTDTKFTQAAQLTFTTGSALSMSKVDLSQQSGTLEFSVQPS